MLAQSTIRAGVIYSGPSMIDGARYGSRSCYVNIGQGPLGVYRAMLRGAYPVLSPADIVAIGSGRMVRLGVYGDPAAVPFEVWRMLLSEASGHTGYTHQWRRPEFQALRAYCMASVDSASEFEEARAAGWRTFRVRTADEPRAPREFVCPASAEGGKKILCQQCAACDGTSTGRKGVPVIIAHGSLARRFESNRIAIR